MTYAPIEQIQGGTGGPRDDIYAVGATLYHLLTGHPPVDALTRAAALINGQPDPLTPIQTLQPLLPAAAAHAIDMALALKLDNRPASVAALQAALTGDGGAASGAYTGTTVILESRRPALVRPGLHPLARSLLAAGIAVVALAVLLLLWRPLDRPVRPPPPVRPPAGDPIRILDPAVVRSVVALPPLGQSQIDAEQVAYSPDGRTLAVAQINGQVLLWDAQRLEAAPRALAAERWRIDALAFSPDSATLAAADAQGRVRL